MQSELEKIEARLSSAGERWLEERAGRGRRGVLTRIEDETREAELRLEQLQQEVSHD